MRIAWSPSGEQLAIGGVHGMLQFYSLVESQVTHSPPVGSETVFDIAYSNTGEQVAIGTQDGCLTLLNPKTGTQMKRHENLGPNGSICFSDKNYAIGTADAVRVFDAHTNALAFQVESRFPAHLCWRMDDELMFAENGGRLVFADRHGKRQLEFRCTLDCISDLDVSRDSTKALVTESTNRVIIWNIASLDELARTSQPTIPAGATIGGRYSDLLSIQSAPRDQSVFGHTSEFGVYPIRDGLDVAASDWIARQILSHSLPCLQMANEQFG